MHKQNTKVGHRMLQRCRYRIRPPPSKGTHKNKTTENERKSTYSTLCRGKVEDETTGKEYLIELSNRLEALQHIREVEEQCRLLFEKQTKERVDNTTGRKRGSAKEKWIT